MSFWALS